ncbi:MAG: hypothetical protein IT215_07100 [Chitinophagaceae bacterium]|nr:hypothetical protein [Chitinophagaceae bacterium]
MIFPKVLSDTAVSAAKGIAKIALGKLLTSVKGDNRGVIVPYRSEGHENIICFVHGFCGNPEETFNPLPQFIIEEHELKGWDIISVGYSTDLMPNIGRGVWAATPDLNKVSNYLKTNLEILFESYSRVVLIGHSMGGLVIQRAVLNLDDINKISHILLFGTPSGGLKKAWAFRWFKNQISDMDYEGIFIKSLRSDWNKKFNAKYPFYFKTVAGELDEFVPVLSSLEPFPEEFRSYTTGNHISMVKPISVDDTSFLIIKSALSNNSSFLKSANPEDLNNLIGNYNDTVKRLQHKVNQLDLSNLRNYIFALEGIGKLDEAIKIIESSEKIKESSDLMGILAGRYKRKYLIECETKYLELSKTWYENGLNSALKSSNSKQIYYHGINLAFLNLMEDNQDLSKTKKFAALSIDHCEKSANNDFWEIATKAEAYLYLNDFDKSKELYLKAIAACNNDLRATSSMFINAFHACNALDKLDWKNELDALFSKSVN